MEEKTNVHGMLSFGEALALAKTDSQLKMGRRKWTTVWLQWDPEENGGTLVMWSCEPGCDPFRHGEASFLAYPCMEFDGPQVSVKHLLREDWRVWKD